MSDNKTAPASSGIDMEQRKRLYEAFQQGKPPSTPMPVKTQGAMAEVLETLFKELVQVEKVILGAAKPIKPNSTGRTHTG